MSKLYLVEQLVQIMVVAEDEDDAVDYVNGAIFEIIDREWDNAETSASEARRYDDIPYAWVQCIPYDAYDDEDDDSVCEEYVE